MTDELKIEMSESDLENFTRFLGQNAPELEAGPVRGVSAGFQREPILIAVVLALGGPVVIKQVVSLIKEWMRLRARKEKLEMQLRVLSANGSRKVTLEQLERLESARADKT